MRKMRNKVLNLFLVVVVSLTICSCTSKQNGLNKQGELTKQNPLDSEAQAEAKRFWDNFSVKCGDSYYAFANRSTGTKEDRLYEFKNFTVSAVETIAPTASQKPMSEADRLNQIEKGKTANTVNLEWDGFIKLNVGANRQFYSGRWHEWQDEMPEEVKLYDSFELYKVDGRWFYGRDSKWNYWFNPPPANFTYLDFMQKYYRKIDCSQIKR